MLDPWLVYQLSAEYQLSIIHLETVAPDETNVDVSLQYICIHLNVQRLCFELWVSLLAYLRQVPEFAKQSKRFSSRATTLG